VNHAQTAFALSIVVCLAPYLTFAQSAAPTKAPAPSPAPATATTKPGATPPAKPATTPPAAPLPPPRAADAVIADLIDAIGGAAALQRHTSLHTKMEITFKGLGITGTAEHWAASGDRALTTTTIPNVATSREGSDGKRLWSEDQINGLRILEGAEEEQARIDATWNLELRLKDRYPKIEVRNEAGENGQHLECLVLTPKLAPPKTTCLDAKTHLMVVERGVRSGPQGEMPYTARTSDWRSVGDAKIAYATEMQVGPMAFSGRVLAAELDLPVDPTMFALPAKGGPAPGAGAKEPKKPKEPKEKQETKEKAKGKPAAAAADADTNRGAAPKR
jgi:hypothetical protein